MTKIINILSELLNDAKEDSFNFFSRNNSLTSPDMEKYLEVECNEEKYVNNIILKKNEESYSNDEIIEQD